MATFTLIGLAASRAGSGKTTVAQALCHQAGFVRRPLAEPLKRIGLAVLKEAGLPELDARRFLYHDRGTIIPGIGVNGRHLLQTLGTEWGRQCISPRLWLNLWRHNVEIIKGHALRQGRDLRIVVDDIRFPNEADMIRRLGGFMWMIERPRTRQESLRELRQRFSPGRLLRSPDLLLPWKLFRSAHASEGGLNHYRGFQARIRNDGAIHELLQHVWEYAKPLGVVPIPPGTPRPGCPLRSSGTSIQPDEPA